MPILDALAADPDPDELPRGRQRALLERYLDLYVRRELATPTGATPPLRRCCPNGKSCWQPAPGAAPRAPKGGISLPWVGAHYEPGARGVVIVGMNFNDASGLSMAIELAHHERAQLRLDRRRITYDHPGYRGTDFPYRTTRSARLVIDLVDGRKISDRKDDGDALADVLDRVVRLQAVKCSPRNDQWSKPTKVMWERCPPMLLADEIGIAAPRFVLAFGQEVHRAVRSLPGFTSREGVGLLAGGTLTHGRSCVATVYFLGHPRSYASWHASHKALRSEVDRCRADDRRLPSGGHRR
jgi:hypothetical protein